MVTMLSLEKMTVEEQIIARENEIIELIQNNYYLPAIEFHYTNYLVSIKDIECNNREQKITKIYNTYKNKE